MYSKDFFKTVVRYNVQSFNAQLREKFKYPKIVLSFLKSVTVNFIQ
jgi:hypothetical protein